MLRFKSYMRTPPVGTGYTQPETGYFVPWETDIQRMFDGVKDHRQAHGLPLPENWREEVEHQVCMTLKVSEVDDWIYDTEKPSLPRLVVYGRAMWAELHERALQYPEAPDEHDKDSEIKWLEGWKARIPSAKCDCAYKWISMGLDFDISSRDGYWESTVKAHNAVNASLGKPIWSGTSQSAT